MCYNKSEMNAFTEQQEKGMFAMIKLWENEVPGFNPEFQQEVPSITPYIVDSTTPHSAIIVCPGGGYARKAEHEGKPIALWLNSIGISAFVLDYRVAPYQHPYPLKDAQRAIQYVRYTAAKWNIDPQRIGILGFSAGGHLASTAGTHFCEGNPSAQDPVETVSSRPNAMVLCYPVITFGEFRHNGSMVNLLGETPDEHLRHSLSTENSVSSDTPPTFLWHTADDASVPVENALLFSNALSRHKVPFEVHIFPKGRHGLGLALEASNVAFWTKLCENWFREIEFIP